MRLGHVPQPGYPNARCRRDRRTLRCRPFMLRTLLVCALVSCIAACGEVKGGSETPDPSTPDAAASTPDASVDAAPPATCAKDGDTCADGSACFEGACGGARIVQLSDTCL